jgi:hypothetical protein
MLLILPTFLQFSFWSSTPTNWNVGNRWTWVIPAPDDSNKTAKSELCLLLFLKDGNPFSYQTPSLKRL